MKTLIVPFLVLLTACSSTPEIEYIQAQCDIPAQPVLPVIDAGELWDRIGSEDFDRLLLREQRLTSWALEMRSMLEAACND